MTGKKNLKTRLYFLGIVTVSVFLLLISLEGYSQKIAAIKGEVKDENKKPFAAASISLYRANDMVLVKAAFTDKNGIYLMEGIKRNSYILSISASGYKKSNTPVKIEGDSDFIVPTIMMLPEVKILKEVTVQAQKPLFEQKADKMVVNVNASPSNAGANALEVLEKSPGITLDKDGNISLKGKAGVQVFIVLAP